MESKEEILDKGLTNACKYIILKIGCSKCIEANRCRRNDQECLEYWKGKFING